LLFARPITRIVKLAVGDVLTRGQDDGQDGQEVYLRLGHPPARPPQVPQPLAALLLGPVATGANIRAASNPDSRWRSRRPRRTATGTQRSVSDSKPADCRPRPAAPQRFASTSCKHPHPGSPPCSATTTGPASTTVCPRAELERAVRQTCPLARRSKEHDTVEYGSAPVQQVVSHRARTRHARRRTTSTAGKPDSRWLFPGGSACQPLTRGALRHRYHALGLPTIPAGTAAPGHLVLQAPAAVISAALGYRDRTGEQHRAAGGTWSRYAVSRRADKHADSRPATAP
jgi:hypothetical protein